MFISKFKLIVLFSMCSLYVCAQKNTVTKNKDISTSNATRMQNENILKPVKALIQAMDAENAKDIKAQFSKTATQAYGADGVMKTAKETSRWLETDIIDRQGKVKNPEYSIISDKEVVVKGQYSSRGYTNKANFLFTVENGLITSWRMRY